MAVNAVVNPVEVVRFSLQSARKSVEVACVEEPVRQFVAESAANCHVGTACKFVAHYAFRLGRSTVSVGSEFLVLLIAVVLQSLRIEHSRDSSAGRDAEALQPRIAAQHGFYAQMTVTRAHIVVQLHIVGVA